jgi:hypothetical protein
MKASFLPFLAVPALMPVYALHQRQSNWTIGQTVQTSSGTVNGHAALNATEVSEYLGIPFAAPPVGDLRFAAPQLYSGSSTINGTSFVSQCLWSETFRGAITELKYRDFLAPPLLSQSAHQQQIWLMQISPPQGLKFWRLLRSSVINLVRTA